MSKTRFHLYSQHAVIWTMILCLVTLLIPVQLVSAAGPNKLYVTPTSSQMNIGTSFTINVRSYSDTDPAVDNVRGTVTYNSGLLKVTGISVSGSNYGSPSISQGAGSINFSGSSTNVGNTAQVFAITFQATAGGTAAVGFSGDSLVNNVETQYTNGSYTITNPNPPTSKPSTKPKPSTAPKVTPVPIVNTPVETPPSPTLDTVAPQPTPDPAGVVDSVNVSPSYTSSSLTWLVNAPNPSATLMYGANASQLDKTAKVTKGADGSFSTSLSNLTPGLRYYFAITGTGDGGKTGTYSGTIFTRGYPITMTITENNQPIASGTVKLGDRSYPVGSGGKLSIGLASGNYSGTITTDTASLSINLSVAAKQIPADGSAPPTQSFPYNLTSSPLEQGPGSGFSILGFIGVMLGGTLVLGLGFVGFMAYRRHKFEGGDSPSHSPSATVVIEDGYDWRQQEAAASGATDVQAGPPPVPIVPQPYEPGTPHHNSVHLTEEEPLDMFDQAPKYPLPPVIQQPSSSIVPPAPGQNPNLPRSTTP